MSLVNDMLNDLEDRRQQRHGEALNLDWLTGQRQNRRSLWLPLLIVAAMVLLLVLAWRAWQIANATPAVLEAAFNDDQVPPSITVSASDKPDAQQAATDVRASADAMTEPAAQITQAASVITAEPAANISVTQEPAAAAPAAKAPVTTASVKKSTLETVTPATTTVKFSKQLPAESAAEPASEAAIEAAINDEHNRVVKNRQPPSAEALDKRAVKEAEKLLRAGQRSRAQQLLEDFVEQQRYAPKAAEKLVALYAAGQQFDQAEALLRVQRGLHPNSIELLTAEAQLLLLQNRAAQAVEAMQGHRPAVSRYPTFYELLGLAARQSSRLDLALNAYQQLLAFDDSRGDWWVGMAIVLDMQSELSLAKDAYRNGLQSLRLTPALKDYAQQRLAAL